MLTPGLENDGLQARERRLARFSWAALAVRKSPIGSIVCRESGMIAHFFRASATISATTLLASSGLPTSRKNAIRAPRMPSGVLKRT